MFINYLLYICHVLDPMRNLELNKTRFMLQIANKKDSGKTNHKIMGAKCIEFITQIGIK